MLFCFSVMSCGEIPVGERADCPLKMNLDPPWMTPADNITHSIYCDQLSIAGTQFLNPIDVSFKTDNTGKSAKNLMWPGVGNNIMDCFKESNCEGNIKEAFTRHFCYAFQIPQSVFFSYLILWLICNSVF